jgi:hypothetical protein
MLFNSFSQDLCTKAILTGKLPGSKNIICKYVVIRYLSPDILVPPGYLEATTPASK